MNASSFYAPDFGPPLLAFSEAAGVGALAGFSEGAFAEGAFSEGAGVGSFGAASAGAIGAASAGLEDSVIPRVY